MSTDNSGEPSKESTNSWTVECSDDESYGNGGDNYRVVSGKRVWEPSGDTIASLYGHLERKGFIELKWQCPGRRSPSVHSSQHTVSAADKSADSKHAVDANSGASADLKANQQLNEFDFEFDANSDASLPAKVNNPRRRSNLGVKKSQANLTKVMQDIKKYQLIDQQSK